jgi:hypothetical protein
MSMMFPVSSNDAIEYVKAYEKVRESVSGAHGFRVWTESDSTTWYAEIDTDNHRTFLELCASLYTELPSADAVTAPVPESDEEEEFLNTGFPVASKDDSWPGAAIGEGVGEEEEESEDDEEEDEDEDEEDDEDEDEEEDEPEEETSQNDEKVVTKLLKPKFVQTTSNKNISVVG